MKGPEFLWRTENYRPQQALYEDDVDPSSPDVRKVTPKAINGHPLTVESLRDLLSVLPLTPNTLLTGKKCSFCHLLEDFNGKMSVANDAAGASKEYL